MTAPRASQPPHDLPGDLADMDPAAARRRRLERELRRAEAERVGRIHAALMARHPLKDLRAAR